MTQDTFYFQEGHIAFPAGFEDRTANVFVPANTEISPNLSIARDRSEANETLKDYVTRQINLLKSRITGHRVVQRTSVTLGGKEVALEGEQIDAEYKSSGKLIRQRQAAFLIAPQRVLIFTASSPRAFDAAFESLWQGWLASCQLRKDPASNTAT
ncbi:MAG: DUF1795 domain-containing protein [Polyangia bacterium]